jgi:hypothetical protein
MDWYKKYAKNYRDALAHRIPAYVLPAALNDEESLQYSLIEKELEASFANGDYDKIEELQKAQASLGRSNPLFVHSFSEQAVPMYLNPQLLADFSTIEELINVAIENFYSKGIDQVGNS